MGNWGLDSFNGSDGRTRCWALVSTAMYRSICGAYICEVVRIFPARGMEALAPVIPNLSTKLGVRNQINAHTSFAVAQEGMPMAIEFGGDTLGSGI